MGPIKDNVIAFTPNKKSDQNDSAYPFERIMKSNRDKKLKLTQARNKANTDVLKSYQIKR